MDSLPARTQRPERRLSPPQVEAVLGRAIELHLREAPGGSEEAISESELLLIGLELGLPHEHVRQALAEMGGGVTGSDWLARTFGGPRAISSRTVARGSEDVGRELDAYLVDVECMVADRRFPGRTVYAPAAGVLAVATRATRRLAGRHPLLRAEHVEVGIEPLDAGSCCVAVTVDLRGKRRRLAATGMVGGGAGGTAAAVAAGLLVAPPAALVGLPLAAAALLATRVAYRGALSETTRRIESLLDRLEHRELARRPALRAMLGL